MDGEGGATVVRRWDRVHSADCQGRSLRDSCTVGTDASSLNPPCLLLQKVLSSQAGSTVDSIVLLNQLQEWADMQQLLSQARGAARGELAGLPS